MFTIPQSAIPTTELLPEPLGKTFPKIGYVPFAVSEKILSKNNKKIQGCKKAYFLQPCFRHSAQERAKEKFLL